MDNATGTLLPISSITPELINRMAKIITKEDSQLSPGEAQEWWPAVSKVMREALTTSTDEESRAMVVSAMEMISENGRMAGPSVVLKILVIGWRMAELYLIESMEKGTAT